MSACNTTQQFRLGLRAHDLGCFPVEELALRVAEHGVDCVQLAPGKAIAGLEMKQGLLTTALAAEIRKAFGKHGLGIEVLGCYINPIHPFPDVRKSLMGLFKEHLHHARDFGCNIVALESGSLNADYAPHPENSGEQAFHELLGSMEELVAEAERCGVVVGIEAVTPHVISTPEKMRRLLDAIPSRHLQVIFDPVNLLNKTNFQFQSEIIRQSFDLFGDRIAVVHAKDFVVGRDHLEICPAGQGMLDYGLILSWLKNFRPEVAILLEEIQPEQVVPSRKFLNNPTLISVI